MLQLAQWFEARSWRDQPASEQAALLFAPIGEVAPGARVRHAQFGVGTVISVEPLDGDAKIVVRFAIGQKTLRAKYARLQPA